MPLMALFDSLEWQDDTNNITYFLVALLCIEIVYTTINTHLMTTGQAQIHCSKHKKAKQPIHILQFTNQHQQLQLNQNIRQHVGMDTISF